MRGIQIFLNGEFMGSTMVSGLPALQNLCQALNLDQNWAEEEKAFYITASVPVTNPDYIPAAHLSVDADGIRMVLYPDPTIVLPLTPETSIEPEIEVVVEPVVESPSPVPVVSPIVQSELPDPTPLDPDPPMAGVAGTRFATPDPRTPIGSGAVFVFRHAALHPGATLDYADDPLVSDSLCPTFNPQPERQQELPAYLPAELQPESSEGVPTPQEPAAQANTQLIDKPIDRPASPPLRTARRESPPPRVHAQATRVIQAGPTVIRI